MILEPTPLMRALGYISDSEREAAGLTTQAYFNQRLQEVQRFLADIGRSEFLTFQETRDINQDGWLIPEWRFGCGPFFDPLYDCRRNHYHSGRITLATWSAGASVLFRQSNPMRPDVRYSVDDEAVDRLLYSRWWE